MLKLTAALALVAITPAHKPDRCHRRYTVRGTLALARSTYTGTRRVSLRELRQLGWREMCQRNPAAQPFARSVDRRLAREHELRVIAARAPRWAIPWPIVKCESGGRNLPPNGAGASGFYQIVPSTWRLWGGSRFASAAWFASRGEQDSIAARIWRGAGSSQWVCASLVAW